MSVPQAPSGLIRRHRAPQARRAAGALRALCAIAGAAAIAGLLGCETGPVAPKASPPPPQPPAPHQLSAESPSFLRLPGMEANKVPVRVGVILPFSTGSANTRGLAAAMMKAAELALFDAGNPDILLMTADDDGTPADAQAAAQKLLDQGAEVIVGPLFSTSVAAVAPIARDRGVPVIAFSTDRHVAGSGVYLLSFQPETEVRRIVSYAAGQGHKDFAALIPATPYGDVVEEAFRDSVAKAGGTVGDVERFSPSEGALQEPVAAVAKAGADAIFIAQGGVLLRGIAPTLSYDGVDTSKVQLLGTGLWDDPAIVREPLLAGGEFAAPAPDADAAFAARYRTSFGAAPPPLAALAYDAISLVALLSTGQPYHRFTQAALTDPNGFSGVDGIFRFRADGTIERGLAVLSVNADGFHVVSPAPTTFQAHGS